jgi:hypothetical protein
VAVIGPEEGRRHLEADAAAKARAVERIVGIRLARHGVSNLAVAEGSGESAVTHAMVFSVVGSDLKLAALSLSSAPVTGRA